MVVFDDDGIPVVSTTAGGTGTSVDPNSTMKTRDIKIRFDDQPVDGYVRLNGRTIGSVASGATERANADTQSLYEELWGYANISVVGGKGSSGPSDFLANKPLTLPNCAGRGIFGMDDMGAGPQGVLTGGTIANPTQVGSPGGTQAVSILQGNLPIYNLTGGSSASFTVSGNVSPIGDHPHHIDFMSQGMDRANPHSHPITTPNNKNTSVQLAAGASAFFWTGNPGVSDNTGSTDINHLHEISGDTDMAGGHTHSFSWDGFAPNITINSGGSGTPMTNLPPIMTFMIYVRL